MAVIITGGTGLIGRALGAALAAHGSEVVLLSRDPSRHRGLPGGLRVLQWDARSAAGWVQVADGAEAIINLAGENLAAGPWTSERMRRIRESRLLAGRAVVEAVQAASRKPAVVVQASAVGYYGPAADALLDESSPPGSDFLARVCQDWEASTAAVEDWGVRRVVVRFGLVLSRRGGVLPKLLLPHRLYVGGPLGSGRQWLSWVHLADAVAALQFLLERASCRGAYNVTAPEPVTNATFNAVVGRLLRRPFLVPVPALLIRLALGRLADVLLTGQRVAPRRLLESGFTFRFPSLEGALRDLLAAGPASSPSTSGHG